MTASNPQENDVFYVKPEHDATYGGCFMVVEETERVDFGGALNQDKAYEIRVTGIIKYETDQRTRITTKLEYLDYIGKLKQSETTTV